MNQTVSAPAIELRGPDDVMRLFRLGSAFPTRLSFMRSLIRDLQGEAARVERPVWQMDDSGYGHAVYSVSVAGYSYSLVAFTQSLDPQDRTDRVIAERWDATFVLFDGVPSDDDIERLRDSVPLQEAGRFRASELVLCRANKSQRMFQHVVDCLSAGQQPDDDAVRATGYLMRTTAVYGNGKFGIADRATLQARAPFGLPFRAEMLAVWLVRGFTLDLVEHIAQATSADAVRLDPCIRRYLGVGNATGLGMAPFLVHHPVLLNAWITARETALARVRSIAVPTETDVDHFLKLLGRAMRHVGSWRVEDVKQSSRIETLGDELTAASALITRSWLLAGPNPWNRVYNTARGWSLETQEVLVALLLEPHGSLVDDLAGQMATEFEPVLQPKMRLGAIKSLLARNYQWALAVDFRDAEASAYFWYVSAEKLEPRLGHRHREPGAEKETPLDIARQVQALHRVLMDLPDEDSVAELALALPKLRPVIARVQMSDLCPYAEIRDNLIDRSCRPIDLLRCKLAFFGASKFDPKSDLWTRITLFQGAPGFDEIHAEDADDWAFPVFDPE